MTVGGSRGDGVGLLAETDCVYCIKPKRIGIACSCQRGDRGCAGICQGGGVVTLQSLSYRRGASCTSSAARLADMLLIGRQCDRSDDDDDGHHDHQFNQGEPGRLAHCVVVSHFHRPIDVLVNPHGVRAMIRGPNVGPVYRCCSHRRRRYHQPPAGRAAGWARWAYRRPH